MGTDKPLTMDVVYRMLSAVLCAVLYAKGQYALITAFVNCRFSFLKIFLVSFDLQCSGGQCRYSSGNSAAVCCAYPARHGLSCRGETARLRLFCQAGEHTWLQS